MNELEGVSAETVENGMAFDKISRATWCKKLPLDH